MSVEISATLVKQLRDRTGAGMMEVRDALVEAAGDVESARKILREMSVKVLRSSRSKRPSGR